MVRHIIPPVEANDTFVAGMVKGSDALSKEFIDNPIIKQYIDNPKCTIILFENPPYAEANGTTNINAAWKESWIVRQMKTKVSKTATNDLVNAFIWSAFKYYLRQDTDSYIVYSPVKYWKAQHLVNKEFLYGFAFNRKHFHTSTNACISVILWSNKDAKLDSFILQGFDMNDDGVSLTSPIELKIDKVYFMLSEKYYSKSPFATPSEDGIACELNGLEILDYKKNRVKTIYDDDMIGYLIANNAGFDHPDLNSGLTTAGRYDANGFFLSKCDYLSKLPMFCASRYITYNRKWTERGRIMKSGDGVARFEKDAKSGKLDNWLRKCLLFTCLEKQNHCRSFTGSDGRFYRNELCLDTTNGDTVASLDIAKLKTIANEDSLLRQWKDLLDFAKATPQYNSDLTYGVYQIYAEMDLSYKDPKTKKTIYKNPEVHSALSTLKELLKKYYIEEIVPTLFKYEFLK